MTTEKPKAPKLGPLFRRAARLKISDPNARRLLALLAAYADAGESSPAFSHLITQLKRAGVPPRFRNPRVVDAQLDELEHAGWLRVEWAGDGSAGPGKRQGKSGKRNRYVLREWAEEAL